jgi:hypothetical protein
MPYLQGAGMNWRVTAFALGDLYFDGIGICVDTDIPSLALRFARWAGRRRPWLGGNFLEALWS